MSGKLPPAWRGYTRMKRLLTAVTLVGFLGLGMAFGQKETNDDNPGKAIAGSRSNGNAGGRGNASLIKYHGGPLILGTTNVYYIWYGNWSGNTATTILTDFANNIGGSPYFNINTTYSDGTGTAVTNAVTLAGSTTDNYSRGASLT